MHTARTPDDDATEPGAAMERFVSALLRWGSRADVRRSMLADKATSATDDWLLRRILEVGPVRLSDLAAWQSVDKSTMTIQIHRLEASELVRRSVDPSDRRAALIAITSAGRHLHEANVARARIILSQLLKDWDDLDRHTLSALLSRLSDQLEGPADTTPTPTPTPTERLTHEQ